MLFMKLDPSEAKRVRVMNPVNYGERVDKLIILDIKVDPDDREFIVYSQSLHLHSQKLCYALLQLLRVSFAHLVKVPASQDDV